MWDWPAGFLGVRSGDRKVFLFCAGLPKPLTATEALQLAEELINAATLVQRAALPAPEVADSSFGEFRAAGGRLA